MHLWSVIASKRFTSNPTLCHILNSPFTFEALLAALLVAYVDRNALKQCNLDQCG